MVHGKIMIHGKMYYHEDKRSFFQKIKNVRLFDSILLCDKCQTSVIVTDMLVLKLFWLDQYPRNSYFH